MHFGTGTTIKLIQRLFYLAIIALSFNSFSAGGSYAELSTRYRIDKSFTVSQQVYVFSGDQKIYGLTVSGSGKLHGADGLIRIILVDSDGRQWLAYEGYPLLADDDTVRVTDACEETRYLDGIQPLRLEIQLVNASFLIDEIATIDEPFAPDFDVAKERKRLRDQAETEKISRINARIKQKGLKWKAGQTSLSKMWFEEKRKLLGSGEVASLQGAEYYVGGVYETKPGRGTVVRAAPSGSGVIEDFDWRDRHGANRPGSPYYDGDPSGSGWITPVKDQGTCGSCWAFAAVGSIEALVNIYFNQQIDLDLSEQDLLSCSGAGDCVSGHVGDAFSYIRDYGVVDEACFPYSVQEGACENKCTTPGEIIFADYDSVAYMGGNDDDLIKERLIHGGPGAFLIFSWNHYVTLVGYGKDPADGRTVWYFKSSWGDQWGDGGYGSIKCGQNGETGCEFIAPKAPVISTVTPLTIGCFDFDGDGYYNWGISPTAPDTCPKTIPAREDCDDSNPLLGFMGTDGACLAIRHVDIDIVPGADDNCIPSVSTGTMAVAVLSTDQFDALQVDPATVTFFGAGSTNWTVADTDGDGDDDALFHFDVHDLNLTEPVSGAFLEGNALDGTPLIGRDNLCIRPDQPPFFENASLPSSVTLSGKVCFSGAAKDDYGLKELRIQTAPPEMTDLCPPVSLDGTSAMLDSICIDTGKDPFTGAPGGYTIALTVIDSANQSASSTFDLEVKPAGGGSPVTPASDTGGGGGGGGCFVSVIAP